jgi:hypothetical protein
MRPGKRGRLTALLIAAALVVALGGAALVTYQAQLIDVVWAVNN